MAFRKKAGKTGQPFISTSDVQNAEDMSMARDDGDAMLSSAWKDVAAAERAVLSLAQLPSTLGLCDHECYRLCGYFDSDGGFSAREGYIRGSQLVYVSSTEAHGKW